MDMKIIGTSIGLMAGLAACATLLPSPSNLTAAITRNANGERVVRVELVSRQSPEVLWRAFSSEASLRCWIAPVVRLDLRVGGSLHTNYTPSAKIGDAGTITLGILNYVENEFITYKVRLNESFSPTVRAQDDRLQQVIQLQRLANGGTKLVASMVGWGNGAEWDRAAAFFVEGNKIGIDQLAKCVANGGS